MLHRSRMRTCLSIIRQKLQATVHSFMKVLTYIVFSNEVLYKQPVIATTQSIPLRMKATETKGTQLLLIDTRLVLQPPLA